MTPSIVLNPDQRQALLDRYRKVRDPEVRFRAHILLLLADGSTWATVATILFWSARTIDRWVKRYQRQGIDALGGQKRGRPFRFDASWIQVVVAWVSKHTPRQFGFLRSRRCCEECFEQAKGEAGLAGDQGRNWIAWHHHQTLALLAAWFLNQETRRGKNRDPGTDITAIASAHRRSDRRSSQYHSPVVTLSPQYPLAATQRTSTPVCTLFT